jgi:hypothetical protein
MNSGWQHRKSTGLAGVVGLLTLLSGVAAHAMLPGAGFEPIEDDELSGMTGEGIAIALEDIRILAGPTSRFEIIGQVPLPPAKKADARWYGISVSSNEAVTSWLGACTAGIGNMGCPIGGTIANLAPFDNPFILRVFDYSGLDFQGATVQQSVFEFLAPTQHERAKVSNWNELVVNNNVNDKLQGQLVFGNAVLNTVRGGVRRNNKIRIVSHTDVNDPTIGFIWENHWRGDFRYSVNQSFISQDTVGVPPWFTADEGFYTRNIEVFFPLGQMFYQSLILDSVPAQDGNFRIELTRPGVLSNTVRQDFYSLAPGDTVGYNRLNRPARYYETHAFFRYGDWTPPDTCANNPANAPNCLPRMLGTNNAATSTDDGMFFVAWSRTDPAAQFQAFASREVPPTGATLNNANSSSAVIPRVTQTANLNVVNLGDGRIEGLLVQHMELITRGVKP